jgi:hypothetical protein
MADTIFKGRSTIRKVTRAGREPRFVEPWRFEAKADTTLGRLERAHFDALAAVDAIEERKDAAKKSGTFTEQGKPIRRGRYASSSALLPAAGSISSHA